MASPFHTPKAQAARTTTAAYSSSKSYPVRLADRLKTKNKSTVSPYTNVSTQIDPSVKFGPTAAEAYIEADPIDDSAVELKIVHRNEKQPKRFTGNVSDVKPSSRRFTLTFDPANQCYILDRVDASITISDSRSDSPKGSDFDRDGSVHSDDESIGAADPDNPFDWRHQFRKRKSSSPEIPVLSDRDSPAPMPVPIPTSIPRSTPRKRQVRKASTPPGSLPGSPPRSTASTPVAAGSDLEIERDDDEPPQRSYRHDDNDGSDNELLIEFDEQPARGRKALSAVFGDRGIRQPRSLASVASSRSRSRQPLSRHREVVDNGFEIDLDPSPPPADSDDEAGAARSDLDVSEMEVGSPVHKPRDRSSRQASEEAMEEEIVVEEEPEHVPEPDTQVDDDDDDMENAFDEVFAQVEEGDESDISEAD